jgi:hypothetical protein
MRELKAISLRPKTQTVSVYTPPLRRLLKEGRAAMETLQVCEVSLPSAGWKEQDDLGEDRSWDKAEQQAHEIRES